MRRSLQKFLTNDSGAAVVEYVVIAAAAVGIGIGATSMVREGATNFANSGTSTASTGVVDTGTGGGGSTGGGDTGGSTTCKAGSADYALMMVSDYDAQDIRDALARYSDEDLQRAFSDLQVKAGSLLSGGSTDELRYVSDDVHMLSSEMADRRLDGRLEGTQLADLAQRLSASTGTDGCNGNGGGGGTVDGGGTGSDYQLLALDDRAVAELIELLVSSSDRSLMNRVDRLFGTIQDALRDRNSGRAGRRIDKLFLTLQEITARNMDAQYISSTQQNLDRLRAEYDALFSPARPTPDRDAEIRGAMSRPELASPTR